MKRFIKKIVGFWRVQEEDSFESTLTNRKILGDLCEIFRAMLKRESVGERMLYPMSFNILMEPTDYEDRKQALPFVLPQVVASFYKIIREMQQVYPDYTPPARYWHFQFSASSAESVVDSSLLHIRKGHMTIVASLLTFDISNTSVDTNTRVSIKLDDSNVMNDVNLNWNAIKNLDIRSEGTFTCKFDDSLNMKTSDIAENFNSVAINGIAELSYSIGPRIYHYIMKDELIHISGSNEKRKERSIFVVECQEIINSHVQIKFISSENKFQLAAFGPVRLNSRELQESVGRNVIWYDLANNSSIFINGQIAVKFNKK